MRQFLVIIFSVIIFFTGKLFCQDNSDVCKKLNEEIKKSGEDLVIEMPKFIGQIDSLKQILDNPHYPDIARRAEVEGRVMVAFIVDTLGLCHCFQVVKGIGAGCDEAAIDLVKSLNLNYTPARLPMPHGYKLIPVRLVLPVTFTLIHK